MPLFMDFHKIPNLTLDDVVNAHMADMAINLARKPRKQVKDLKWNTVFTAGRV